MSDKVHAVITAVGGYLPDYILTNQELSTMMDTSDEWIMTRIGIKTRHILKDEHEGTSYLGAKAVEELLAKSKTDVKDIDLIICATSTSDHQFPATAASICERVGIKGALAYDIQAACSGFIVGLTTAAALVETGRFKKVIVLGAEKMSFMVDYQGPLHGTHLRRRSRCRAAGTDHGRGGRDGLHPALRPRRRKTSAHEGRRLGHARLARNGGQTPALHLPGRAGGVQARRVGHVGSIRPNHGTQRAERRRRGVAHPPTRPTCASSTPCNAARAWTTTR